MNKLYFGDRRGDWIPFCNDEGLRDAEDYRAHCDACVSLRRENGEIYNCWRPTVRIAGIETPELCQELIEATRDHFLAGLPLYGEIVDSGMGDTAQSIMLYAKSDIAAKMYQHGLTDWLMIVDGVLQHNSTLMERLGLTEPVVTGKVFIARECEHHHVPAVPGVEEQEVVLTEEGEGVVNLTDN